MVPTPPKSSTDQFSETSWDWRHQLCITEQVINGFDITRVSGRYQNWMETIFVWAGQAFTLP
jgi:hypothetical protein